MDIYDIPKIIAILIERLNRLLREVRAFHRLDDIRRRKRAIRKTEKLITQLKQLYSDLDLEFRDQ